MPDLGTLILQAIYAFVATFGFAVLFNVPPHTLIAVGLVGAGGHLVRFTLRTLGASNEVSTYAGALFVGIVGYFTAVRFHLPRLVFTVTGIIAMVPGVSAYEVLVYFSEGDMNGGVQSAVRVALVTGAIAAGLGTARIVTDTEWAKIPDTLMGK